MEVRQEGALAAITAVLEAARAGRGGQLLLDGDAGVGKTSVLRVAVEHAADMRVVQIAGVEPESGLPHAGLHLLCSFLGAELDALAARERHVLEVALGRRDGPAPTPFAVGAALLELLTATAGRSGPLLLVVDDLHWLDRQSRAAVTFALRRLGGEAVAALLATRPGGPTAGHDNAVMGFPNLTLTGIGLDAAVTMAAGRGLAVSRPVMADLLAATDGNPLAVLLATRELHPAQRLGLRPWTPGPTIHLDRRVGAEVLDSLADSTPDATLALLVIALSESEDRALLQRALDVAGVTPAALGVLAERRLVHLGPTAIALTHPLVRPAIARQTTAAQHRLAHRALAQALESQLPETQLPETQLPETQPAQGTRDPDGRGDFASAALHRAAAAVGPDEELARRLQSVGELAAARGDLAGAARAYEAAAELSASPQSRALRYRLAGHAAATAGLDSAERLLTVARRHASDPLQRLEVDALSTAVAAWSGDYARALAISARYPDARYPDAQNTSAQNTSARNTGAQHPDALPPGARAALAVIHGSAAAAAWARWDAAALARCAALVPGELSDLPPAAVLVGTAGRALATLATGADPTADLLAAAAIHHAHPDPDFAPPLLQALVLADLCDTAETVLADALTAARHRAAVPALAWLFLASAQLAFRRGELGAALAWAREATDLADAVPLPLACVQSRVYAALVAATIGGPQPRRNTLPELAPMAGDLGNEAVLVYLHLADARAATAVGDVAGAVACYRETTRRLALLGRPALGEFPALPELITVLMRAGRTADARAAADQLPALIADDRRPSSRAWAAHVRALLSSDAAADTDYAAAFAAWTAAGAGIGTALPAADLHHDDGLRLVRQRRFPEARVAFGAALRAFDTCGAVAGALRATDALATLGAAPPPRVVTPTGLTSREQTIASLVATGSTNRQIAQTLFLSHKTVESHLGSIFRKLGVQTRTEMAHQLNAGGSPR